MGKSSFFSLLAALLVHAAPAGAVCSGDCDGDGFVRIDELVLGASITLGRASLLACASLDSDGDGHCSIDELIGAVHAALEGCPPTPTPTPSGTPTPTVTSTPTPTPNEPPVARCLTVYRGFAGRPIDVTLQAQDSAEDVLHYSVETPPDGAQLDALNGRFTWTPGADQIGPFYLPFTATDSGMPPLSAQGLVAFAISPQDGVAQPDCDPARGCQVTLPPVEDQVCGGGPVVRVPEPVVGCPEGRVVYVGANRDLGFGRLYNCDRLRMDGISIGGGQTGASMRVRLQARCLRTADELVTVQIRLETATRLVFEGNRSIVLSPGTLGFDYGTFVFPIRGPGPFFDLEDAEANLTLRVTDADGTTVSTALRVILTSNRLDDLPDVDETGPTPPEVNCTNDQTVP
jgi:hypothetical protein